MTIKLCGDLGTLYEYNEAGWEDPLENERAAHSSILVWRIPWAEEAGGLQSMGDKELGMAEVT